MNRAYGWLRFLLIGYVVTVIVAACVVVGLGKAAHLQLFDVQTGSMEPAFKPGDAVVLRPTNNVQAGQIITYTSPINGQLVSHRVIAVDTARKQLTTRGDNEKEPDTPINRAAVVGRVVMLLPQLGRVVHYLKSPLGLATFLYLPAILLVVNEIKRLTQHYRRGYYRLFSFR